MIVVHRHRLSYLLVAFGFLYLLLLDMTGIGIPCLFHLVTGLKCPGCGVTTMLLSLFRLDFLSAYRANPFLLLTLPFLVFEILFAGIYLPYRKKRSRANDIVLLVYILAFLAFGILRNVLSF